MSHLFTNLSLITFSSIFMVACEREELQNIFGEESGIIESSDLKTLDNIAEKAHSESAAKNATEKNNAPLLAPSVQQPIQTLGVKTFGGGAGGSQGSGNKSSTGNSDDDDDGPSGPVISEGEPDGFVGSAGFRIKGAPGPDIYLGVPDLGVGANRNQADAGNPLADGTYPITFNFDTAENRITLAGPGAVNLVYDFDVEVTQLGCPQQDQSALVILVRDSRNNGGAGLQNVVLQGNAIGNFAPPDGLPDIMGTPGFQQWTVTGLDFTGDLELTADLVITNLSANEALRVEVQIGCVP